MRWGWPRRKNSWKTYVRQRWHVDTTGPRPNAAMVLLALLLLGGTLFPSFPLSLFPSFPLPTAQLGHGGCTDEHLQDQVIIFMALASGTSQLLTGPLSLHTKTSLYFGKALPLLLAATSVNHRLPCLPWGSLQFNTSRGPSSLCHQTWMLKQP